MKRILLLLLPVFSVMIAFSQLHVGVNYTLSVPQKQLAENINLINGSDFSILYQFKKKSNLRAGIQIGWGTYAQEKQDQHYEFSDGTSTDVTVTFSSNVFNAHMVADYDLLRKADVIPFVTARGGISKFHTKILIPNPDDVGSCRPLENKNMFKDATWSAGGGGGARMNMNKIFKKMKCNHLWIESSVNYLTGGNVDYLNVKHLHHDENPQQTAKEFNVRFVNIATSQLHEHQVAKVLNSRINQWDIKLGLMVRL